jgi:ABC-2 type transport system permease protein
MNRVFVTLIQREFWENKSLWIAPLAAAALVLVGALFGQMHIDMDNARTPTPERVGMIMMAGIGGFLGFIACLTVVAYLTDCLYGERKDRSILFWKSLPVSDLQTVLSKLTVAMIVVPLGVLLLAVVTQMIAAGMLALRTDVMPLQFGVEGFPDGWLELLGWVIAGWFYFVLWYAPVAVYLMLASVLAKRAPIAYAVLPWVVLSLGEKLILGSTHIGQFVGHRLAPTANDDHSPGPNGDWLQAFADPNLWLGLAVAAGMLYIVVRLRRYRDDT